MHDCVICIVKTMIQESSHSLVISHTCLLLTSTSHSCARNQAGINIQEKSLAMICVTSKNVATKLIVLGHFRHAELLQGLDYEMKT
jgi:hypothetical protein